MHECNISFLVCFSGHRHLLFLGKISGKQKRKMYLLSAAFHNYFNPPMTLSWLSLQFCVYLNEAESQLCLMLFPRGQITASGPGLTAPPSGSTEIHSQPLKEGLVHRAGWQLHRPRPEPEGHSPASPEVTWPEKGVLLKLFCYTVKNLATQFCKHVCIYIQHTHIPMYYFKEKKISIFTD